MRYSDEVEIYDPAKIGTRIAWGRSHSVYRYGDDEVIRFPRAEIAFQALLHDRLSLFDRYKRDIEICEKYFGDFFLATRIVEAPDGKIATIQPYITGHFLSKNDLRDKSSRSRFQEFVKRYETMVAVGYELDLIGQGGVLRRRLSNILVLPGGNIKLFDAKTFDARKIREASYIVQFVALLVYKRQRSTLRFLLS